MNQDELKDLMNDKFGQEPIAFDPSSWNKMEKMLDQQSGRKGGWYWFSGIMVALIAGLAFYLSSASAIYTPRLAEAQYDSFDSYTIEDGHLQPTEAEVVSAKSPSDLSANDQLKKEANPVNAVTLDESSTKNPGSTALSEDKDMLKDQSGDTILPPVAQSDPELDSASETIADVTNHLPETTSIDEVAASNLELMPMIRFSVQRSDTTFTADSVDRLSTKRFPEYYVRFGLTHSLKGGFGQIGGVGIDYQIANRLILSGELLMARDVTDYALKTNSVYYGYERRDIERTSVATEMISIEAPLTIQYRFNRMRVGTGLSVGYLLSTKVEERSPSVSGAGIDPTVEEVGFVRWEELQPLQLSIPVDFQYQLNERYSLGGRYRLGLTDAFSETPEIDRLQRIDCYVKMRLYK